MKIDDEMMQQLAVQGVGRLIYLQYCGHKHFDPKPLPYVPGWAVDYARVAVDALGFDDDAFNDLMEQAQLKEV